MDTTKDTTAARPNMNGTQRRAIHSSVRTVVANSLTERFNDFDGEAGDQLQANLQPFLDELAAFIKAMVVKYSAKAPKLFSFASTYAHGALPGKKTKKCFTGKLWYYRHSYFDTLLGVDQPSADAGTITVLTSEKSWTFREAAVSALNVSLDTPLLTLARLLIERGHTMPLTKLEAIVQATERGEKTGLVTNAYSNFAFTETGNENDPVAVARVYRDGADRPWLAIVIAFAYGLRWKADRRLLLCNLDPSKLGL